MLAAGRAFRWRAFAADPDVVNTQRACRKWPSTALIRGSPRAVTVARFSVRIPVRIRTSSSASSRRGSVMMLRRCSVARAYAASRSLCSSVTSAAVSFIFPSLTPAADKVRVPSSEHLLATNRSGRHALNCPVTSLHVSPRARRHRLHGRPVHARGASSPAGWRRAPGRVWRCGVPRRRPLRHRRTVVPLQVVIGGTSYDDGATSADALAEALKTFTPVSTSRPAPQTFADTYADCAADGAEAVVSIHLSGDMSGTFEAAMIGAKDSPIPVRVVDSRSLGMGLGFPVLAAAAAASAG